MKIGILGGKDSNKPKDFQKFKAAAEMLDISVEYYNSSNLIIEVHKDNVRILDYNMQPIQVDGIVNWMLYAKNYYELYEAFSYANIPCINSVSSVRNCRNKLLTNIILSKYKLPQPKTIFMSKLLDIPEISLKTPIVFKKKDGGGGIGARKFDDFNETNDFLEEKLGHKDLYLQEYVKNNGWDMRVMVVGNKVIGGIKKIAKEGEWRTHVAHGGRAEPYQLNDTVISMCLEATQALNLDFAGIDIIQDIQGNYFILEVNSRPGMSIFYETTGISIAYEILKYFKQKILELSVADKMSSVNYYQIVPSKMEKTQIIMENPLIKPYVPETLYLNLNNLKYMLNQFPMVVFKPDKGSRGNNVGLIKRNDKTTNYTIHYETNFYENMSIDEIIPFIKKLASNKQFIIQKGIDLIRYNNNPVDVRALLQKPYQYWEVTGIIAKIAAKNKMVTNLHAGGTGIPLIDVLKNTSCCESDIKKLKTIIYDLAYNVADTLNRTYPGLRELGIDIGIDNNLYPWILEVNTKPQYSKFALLEDKTMYNTIDKYNKIIHSSIEYYDRKNKVINNDDYEKLAIEPEQYMDYKDNKENKDKFTEYFSINNSKKSFGKHKKCHCNCCKLGEMLVESGVMLETSLSLFLEAESKKIQYLIGKDVCPEKLIEVNEQIRRTIEKIQYLDRQILEKIDKGLSICGCTDDES
ncbi:RimK family alpha-L-glutamate ligase [Tepidibacter aestuarii]|uniref:RimK family alpha-L-glutamate ligase n=1 Tax=Tepidibacter aestuarii TaxID=2925782 RepID=UPI0020C0ADF7|nr:RimK family alpha-L-glutamate ligase [Tepidibacter aestuarii]CAH2213519.1 protein of unknown function [Tepidibacter aestuarii]